MLARERARAGSTGGCSRRAAPSSPPPSVCASATCACPPQGMNASRSRVMIRRAGSTWGTLSERRSSTGTTRIRGAGCAYHPARARRGSNAELGAGRLGLVLRRAFGASLGDCLPSPAERPLHLPARVLTSRPHEPDDHPDHAEEQAGGQARALAVTLS